MKIIDRYLLRQLVQPFIWGLAGSTVIISFGHLLRAVKFLSRGTAEPGAVLTWFVLRVPEDMQYIFPAATLLAALFVFGTLSRNGELDALLAAGVSLARLVMPVAGFGVLVTLGVALFLDRIVPPAMRRSQEIWDRDLKHTAPPDVRYKRNILLRSRGDRLVHVSRFAVREGVLEALMIREYGEGGVIRVTTARRARLLEKTQWLLEGVQIHHHAPGEKVRFEERETMKMLLSEAPEDFLKEERPPDQMSFGELLSEIRYLEERGLSNTRPKRVDLYLKTAFPFSAIIFALLGAGLGMSPARSGGFIGFGLSMVITFMYYVVMSLASSLGKTGLLDPLVASWLHNLIFLAVAAAVLARGRG